MLMQRAVLNSAMMENSMAKVMRKRAMLQDPPLVQALLNDPRAGWLWAALRIWLGWQWFDAASHKIFDPKWVQTGEALKGFWANAASSPPGKPMKYRAIAFAACCHSTPSGSARRIG